LRADEQNREDVKVKRDEWNATQPDMDSAKLVFLDESSVNTAATRLYGRGLNGERVNDHVPEAHIESTTIRICSIVGGKEKKESITGGEN